jgi:hypothetical protein
MRARKPPRPWRKFSVPGAMARSIQEHGRLATVMAKKIVAGGYEEAFKRDVHPRAITRRRETRMTRRGNPASGHKKGGRKIRPP